MPVTGLISRVYAACCCGRCRQDWQLAEQKAERVQTEPLAFPVDIPADSALHAAGPELLTHMADGLPTGKTWVRGNEGLPSPSCTQGPCKSRSVRTINCTLDGDTVTISYSRKVSGASWSCCVTCCCCLRPDCDSLQFRHRCRCLFCILMALHQCAHACQGCAGLIASK